MVQDGLPALGKGRAPEGRGTAGSSSNDHTPAVRWVVSVLRLGYFVSAFVVAILKMLDWVFKRGLSLQLLPLEPGQGF